MRLKEESTKCFRDLQNYTTLKQGLDCVHHGDGFRDLQNYTTLKLRVNRILCDVSFRDLQNYTTLKRG